MDSLYLKLMFLDFAFVSDTHTHTISYASKYFKKHCGAWDACTITVGLKNSSWRQLKILSTFLNVKGNVSIWFVVYNL